MKNLEKLEKQNNFYDIVFERLNVYFFTYDIEKRTVICPEETTKAFGCKKLYENMPQSFADDFVADEYRQKFFQFYEDCNDGKEDCECVFEDKGKQYIVSVKLQIVKRDRKGKPLLALGVIENQVDIKAMLRKQNLYINAILSNATGYMEINLSKDKIVGDIIDASSKDKPVVIDYFNDADKMDRSYNEFERWWSEIMLVSDREEFLEVSNCDYLLSCYKKGMKMVDVYCRCMTSMGTIAENKQTYYLSKDSASEDIMAMCVIYDLTKQKDLDMAMHHKNLIIQKLADEFTGICYVNLDEGTMVDYRVDTMWDFWENQQKEEFNYLERVEQFAEFCVLEKDKEKYKHNLNPETIKNNLKEQETYFFDYRVKEEDEIHYYRAKIVADNYSIENSFVIIGFKNIDEEMKQQRLLEETLQYAQHASKAKTNFLSNMSHDMRTPMNAIMGFTSLANANIDNKEKVKEYLQKITKSGNHLLSLINNILDMSHIESGKMVLNEREENLAEILHDLERMLQPQLEKKNLDFFIDTCEVREELVYCDRIRLEQVLLNIFNNAIKYTESGGMISVRIIQKENQQREYGNYEFYIKDTGKGMSKEFLQHVFEPFEREEKNDSDDTQGTGLGLSIVKNIIDMMNGKIEVISEKGKGSEFIISLTFKLQTTKRVEYDFSQIEGWKALVVDDDFFTCYTVTRMLREIGMCTEFAINGKEAIQKVKKAKEVQDDFLFYIVDWMMPGMSGVEVVKEIRKEIGDKVPIVVLTAYDKEKIAEEAKEAGVTAICEKPLFMSNLKEMIATVYEWKEVEEDKKEVVMDFSGKKVLLAEDIEINQEIANEILTEKGFIVTIVENGKEAVECIKQAKPGEYDIILMDIRMPEMNGYEATKAIRELDSPYKDIPIVAVTANAFEDDRQMSFRVGMNEHISKPLEEEKMFAVLWTLLS